MPLLHHKNLILLSTLLHCASLYSISIVYNFRIAQITRQPLQDNSQKNTFTTVALFFDQYRKKRTGIHQNFIGGLTSLIYGWGPYYLRTDFAASYIKENLRNVTLFSGAETDDILFTFGRDLLAQPQQKTLTLSGLFGIPTHSISRLRHIDFGYSQVGIGIQLDGSYKLNARDTGIYGGRHIYFIPRKARDRFDAIYNFTIGNITDFLLAYKNRWNTQHGTEFGYTCRFRYGADSDPDLDDIVERANYIRSSFYTSYNYKFLIKNTASRIIWYISYGFDHRPQRVGNNYIVTLWSSWNINF